MDFANPKRAIESLGRRRPILEDEIIDISQKLLKSDDDFVSGTVSLLKQELSQRWEPLAVGLYLTTDLLQNQSDHSSGVYVEGPRVPSTTNTEEKKTEMELSKEEVLSISVALLETCKNNLEHNEPRVRTLVAKGVGALVKIGRQETSVEDSTKELHDSVVKSLYEHLKAGRDTSKEYSKSTTGALDDTTGWRALETNWQALASYIAAVESSYWDKHPISTELLEACEYSCITHVNRHVRAAGIAVMEHWIRCSTNDAHCHMLLDTESPLRASVVKILKVTLADNWSQVRMAASVLCRVWWQSLLQYPEEQRNVGTLYPILIPRMCLNRFYLAQGVKLYSHETWRILFEHGGGIEAVASQAGAVCRYYVKMCDADNHVVREAACQAVAELATKLGSHPEHSESLQPYVQTLLQALLMCFHDESWPVRDEACLACGTFCRAYPEECLSDLPMLKERWMEQLTDQIWSVREDAAVALGDAIVAYGKDMLDEMLAFFKKTLPAARQQPAMSMDEYKKRQNDIDSHTDSQLYSCGSLAPKLRKGGAGRLGCSSCGITRPKAPWEATDGCVYLMRQIIGVCANNETLSLDDNTLLPLMTELADVCRVNHFPQGDDLRATLWRQLPEMASSLGKTRFKRLYLEIFMDLLFRNLEQRTASALSRHAAGQCAEELSELVGPMIFRGRLDDFQRETFDRVIRERKQMSQGPSNDAFSPFGPPGLLTSSDGRKKMMPPKVVGGMAAGVHPGLLGAGAVPAAGEFTSL